MFAVGFPALHWLLAKLGQSYPPREAAKFFSDVVEQVLQKREQDKDVGVGGQVTCDP